LLAVGNYHNLRNINNGDSFKAKSHRNMVQVEGFYTGQGEHGKWTCTVTYNVKQVELR